MFAFFREVHNSPEMISDAGLFGAVVGTVSLDHDRSIGKTKLSLFKRAHEEVAIRSGSKPPQSGDRRARGNPRLREHTSLS